MLERSFQKVHLSPDVDLAAYADGLEGATGADIAHACREALMCLLRRDLSHSRAVLGSSMHDQHATSAPDAAAEQDDLLLTVEDMAATVVRARRSVSPEEVTRFEGMRDALLSGSLPPQPPRAGGGAGEQVEQLAKAMLKERATARITQLQGLLRDAAGVMQAQQEMLQANGVEVVQGGKRGGAGAVWDKVMAAVAALGDGEEVKGEAPAAEIVEEEAAGMLVE